MLRSVKRFFRDFDWPLFAVVTVLMGVSIVFVYAAAPPGQDVTKSFAFKQGVWSLIGVGFLFMVTIIGYRTFINLSYVIYLVSIVLLVAVFFIGAEKMGAQRWIPLGPFALQPSEFAKLGVILALAHHLGSRETTVHAKRRFIAAMLITMVPLVFILKQPDLGTSLIFMPILFCMLFIWGTRLRYLLMTLLMAIGSMPVMYQFLKEYQKKRLLTFINVNADPLGAGYTAIQSKIAVGSGGFWGKGLLAGSQSRLNFVPEHHTDFIFCVIAEEGGYIMVVALLLLFFLFLKLSFDVVQRTKDPEAKLLATGVAVMIMFQLFINIGMTVGICPIAGVPLPFISYGGSSMIVNSIACGLLMSMYKERMIF